MLRAVTPVPLLLLACCYPTHDREMETRCPDSPLLEALRREGTLPVLVAIKIEFRPQAELGEGEAAEQRQRIGRAQEQLIAQLENTGREVLRRYRRLPLLALRVDEPALCRLLTSPLVRSVEIDTEVPPSER